MQWKLGELSPSLKSPAHFEIGREWCSCHLGKSIVYDTVSNKSWAVDLRTHGIANIIEQLLSAPWPPSVEEGREVPQATAEVDCVVSTFNC